jgi:hypothetical protein
MALPTTWMTAILEFARARMETFDLILLLMTLACQRMILGALEIDDVKAFDLRFALVTPPNQPVTRRCAAKLHLFRTFDAALILATLPVEIVEAGAAGESNGMMTLKFFLLLRLMTKALQVTSAPARTLETDLRFACLFRLPLALMTLADQRLTAFGTIEFNLLSAWHLRLGNVARSLDSWMRIRMDLAQKPYCFHAFLRKAGACVTRLLAAMATGAEVRVLLPTAQQHPALSVFGSPCVIIALPTVAVCWRTQEAAFLSIIVSILAVLSILRIILFMNTIVREHDFAALHSTGRTVCIGNLLLVRNPHGNNLLVTVALECDGFADVPIFPQLIDVRLPNFVVHQLPFPVEVEFERM